MADAQTATGTKPKINRHTPATSPHNHNCHAGPSAFHTDRYRVPASTAITNKTVATAGLNTQVSPIRDCDSTLIFLA